MKSGINEITYCVHLYNPEGKYTTEIESISKPAGYTTEQYLEDCYKYADDEWIAMISAGHIHLTYEDEEGRIYDC